ncbi:hypothetical protein BCR42DRAFT_427142 [Absidia repens]|uniref:Uncharacterized protein n=1 Tax=Absidia repens TaxID=90262 RepID=A0A1X2I0C8_9FUNG|nr:hypothetical protein BCR42DRAFT_427142 [Absidia repens]
MTLMQFVNGRLTAAFYPRLPKMMSAYFIGFADVIECSHGTIGIMFLLIFHKCIRKLISVFKQQLS